MRCQHRSVPSSWDSSYFVFPSVIHFSVILMIKLHFPERSLKDWEQWQQTVKTEAARYILVICLQKKITRAALSFPLPQWYVKHYSNHSILSVTNSPPHRPSENSRKSHKLSVCQPEKRSRHLCAAAKDSWKRKSAWSHCSWGRAQHLAGTSAREEDGTKENMLGLEHGWEEQRRSTGGKQQQCCCPCVTVTLQLSASPHRTK